MALIDDMTLGRYVGGDSFLHRLDPRLKLTVLPLLVIAAFSAHTAGQRLALALLAGALVVLAGCHWRFFLRGLWVLRWLFLCTVLLHLFFSPGRTLFGSLWLSLDGLLRGLQVCEQLALAIVFSSLLTLSTSPAELASAVSALLLPLGRFGLPARELSLLLLLVLHFIPILREEGLAQLAANRASADRLALAVAAGEQVVEPLAPLPPCRQLQSGNFYFLLALVFCLIVIFGMLR
jgi:energy-coupling factor transport system permease protein